MSIIYAFLAFIVFAAIMLGLGWFLTWLLCSAPWWVGVTILVVVGTFITWLVMYSDEVA